MKVQQQLHMQRGRWKRE